MLDGGVDLSPYIAEIADRLHDRLTEVSCGIQESLEGHIPELRGDAWFRDCSAPVSRAMRSFSCPRCAATR